MKKSLIGAGGFAAEVSCYIDKNIIKFVDDEYYIENNNNILPISKFNINEYELLIAIGDPIKRKLIVERLDKNAKYFTFIHNSSKIFDDNILIGEGSIITPNCILTTDIKLGNHSQLNIMTTIGHNCEIGDYFTTAPGVKISGNCKIGNNVYIGTNASIKEKITICDNVLIGLNTGVVSNITIPGVYVGTPAKLIKEFKNG